MRSHLSVHPCPSAIEPRPAVSRTPTALSPLPRALCPAYFAPWLLTPVVLLVHGYHPFAGDAGIYTAGIRHILDPSLYPLNSSLIDAFTRRSAFAWTVAALVRITHAPLAWILLPLHLCSIVLFLIACQRLANRFFVAESVRWCAVLLAAACCSLPVAGTALVLMDPYVTARSFSTPLSLLALAACLDRAWVRSALLLALAVIVHPLMGSYAVAFVLLLALVSTRRIRTAFAVCVAGLAIAALLFAAAHRIPEPAAYRQAIDLPQRTFLFLARWHWYEVLGLIMPLALYGVALVRLPRAGLIRAVCLTAILLGTTSFVIAVLFVPPAGPWLLVALQPLRALHIVYAVGVVLCGGVLGKVFERHRLLGLSVVLLLFAAMASAEHVSWPDCNRVEWPGVRPENPYQQAFLWIRNHTPQDAIFAFDPQFVYWPGEDEQGFRALTERDHLADDKDAGIVAVIPSLAPRWAEQRNAAARTNIASDAERRATLLPTGATWLLLPPFSPTNLPCPLRNQAVQVCQLSSPTR